MSPRTMRLAPLLVASLLVASPVHAQEPGPVVTYGDVSVTLSPALGLSVSVVPVAGDALDAPVMIPRPAHLVFSISGITREQEQVPGPWGAKGILDVLTTTDLEAYPWASEQLTQLRTLLETRPDIATLEDRSAMAALPYMSGGEAAPIVRALPHFIDTPQLSGIAYVAAFGQDVYRMGRDDFRYIFQGLSADGSRYIEVSWVLRVPGFPKNSGYDPADDRPGHYDRYLDGVVSKLDATDASAIKPPLDELDAFVRSITFAGIPSTDVPPAP